MAFPLVYPTLISQPKPLPNKKTSTLSSKLPLLWYEQVTLTRVWLQIPANKRFPRAPLGRVAALAPKNKHLHWTAHAHHLLIPPHAFAAYAEPAPDNQYTTFYNKLTRQPEKRDIIIRSVCGSRKTPTLHDNS